MTIPAISPVQFGRYRFFSYIPIKEYLLKIDHMEIYYIEAGIFDRMLGCVESLSTRVDRLYEKNANKGVGE